MQTDMVLDHVTYLARGTVFAVVVILCPTLDELLSD